LLLLSKAKSRGSNRNHHQTENAQQNRTLHGRLHFENPVSNKAEMRQYIEILSGG
jgi:hypothetical protein